MAGEEEEYPCEICGKSFKKVKAKNAHQRWCEQKEIERIKKAHSVQPGAQPGTATEQGVAGGASKPPANSSTSGMGDHIPTIGATGRANAPQIPQPPQNSPAAEQEHAKSAQEFASGQQVGIGAQEPPLERPRAPPPEPPPEPPQEQPIYAHYQGPGSLLDKPFESLTQEERDMIRRGSAMPPRQRPDAGLSTDEAELLKQYRAQRDDPNSRMNQHPDVHVPPPPTDDTTGWKDIALKGMSMLDDWRKERRQDKLGQTQGPSLESRVGSIAIDNFITTMSRAAGKSTGSGFGKLQGQDQDQGLDTIASVLQAMREETKEKQGVYEDRLAQMEGLLGAIAKKGQVSEHDLALQAAGGGK